MSEVLRGYFKILGLSKARKLTIVIAVINKTSGIRMNEGRVKMLKINKQLANNR